MKAVTKTSTSKNVEVSINVNNEGVLSLSGQFKRYGEQICAQWNAEGCKATVKPNPYGNQLGYVLESSNGVLVGFLNLYDPDIELEVVQALLSDPEVRFNVMSADELLATI